MARTRKTCKVCKQTRSLEDFSIRPSSGNFRSTCELCRRSIADSKKNVRYNLQDGEYEALYEFQKGLCAICHKAPTPADHVYATLCVDHDHGTGAIRGLLCASCNSGLGFFRDSITLLKNAQLYLTRSRYSQVPLDAKLNKRRST